VDVGSGDRHPKRHSAAIGEHVTLDTFFGSIRRVGTRQIPPFGAFTIALSRLPHCQSMPRVAS
jgi:hypothetical protein